MSTEKLFNPGRAGELIPEVDVARQAVNSLGGYAYQALVSTLAWLDLKGEHGLILEIAEDYAVVAKQAINAGSSKTCKQIESGYAEQRERPKSGRRICRSSREES